MKSLTAELRVLAQAAMASLAVCSVAALLFTASGAKANCPDGDAPVCPNEVQGCQTAGTTGCHAWSQYAQSWVTSGIICSGYYGTGTDCGHIMPGNKNAGQGCGGELVGAGCSS